MSCSSCFMLMLISIHALREESDVGGQAAHSGQVISIHALREESDPDSQTVTASGSIFQSTLSVRRATRPTPPRWTSRNFNPRSP